jgi:hypothetical protein
VKENVLKWSRTEMVSYTQLLKNILEMIALNIVKLFDLALFLDYKLKNYFCFIFKIGWSILLHKNGMG